MRFLPGLFAMIGVASAAISAGEFEKISLWGPYQVAMYPYYNNNQCIGDTAGYAPESYFGQMKELGLNAAITWGDSISTNNVHGIKVFSNTTGLIMYGGCDLDNNTGRGNYFISEVEQSTQSYQLGTWWDHGEGTLYFDGPAAGWLCNPQIDDSGIALQFPAWTPPKWGFKHRRTYHTDVTMKVWDTSATDTICAIARRFSSAEWVCDTTLDYDSTPPFEQVTCYYSSDQNETRYDTTYFTGACFAEPDVWESFSLPVFECNDWYGIDDIKVIWYGQDSIAFDRFIAYDSYGRAMAALDSAQFDTAFNNYYSSINMSGLGRHSPGDEPRSSQFSLWDMFDDASSRCGGVKICPSIRWDIPYYLAEVEPTDIMPNWYSLEVYYDSATTCDSTSVQTAWDDFVSWLATRASYASEGGAELWQVIQAGGWIDEATGDPTVWQYRSPTGAEMKTQMYLSIAYGASGIGYFPYCQLFYADSNGCEPEGEQVKSFAPFPPVSTRSTWTAFTGLVDWDAEHERYEPNVRWDSVKAAHMVIDSLLWPVMDTLEWAGASGWKTASGIAGSAIDTVYSLTFDPDSTYVEVGRFSSGDGMDFYLFVNRRSLAADSQSVAVNYCLGYPAEITEYVSGLVDTVYDSGGYVATTLELPPASVRFCRVRPITGFAGYCSGEWGPFSTINVTGDITVASGDTLTITNSNMTISAVSDELSSGVSSSLTEFIVDGGSLRIDGTPSERIMLDPNTTASPGWYGIRVLSGGHLFIDNAIVKNAYAGIWVESGSVDTVTYSRVEDCCEYGVRMAASRFFMNRDTIISSDSTSYAVWVEMSADTSILWNSFIYGTQNGVYIDSAGLDIEATDFYAIDSSSSAVTEFAIHATNGSYVKIDEGEICNFETGILISGGSEVVVDSCHFLSDILLGPSSVPTMRYGIYGIDSPSRCTVRRTCLEAMVDAAVFRPLNGSQFDLGIYTDSGENEFWCDTVSPPDLDRLYRFPRYAIYNTSNPDTIMAVGDYWSDYARVAGHVDQSVPMTWRQPYCHAAGSHAKLSDAEPEEDVIPAAFSVDQNYPNPFNPQTTIVFSLPEAKRVRLRIFNILGELVATVLDRGMTAGKHLVVWDGRDASGKQVSSGVYFYRLMAGRDVVTRKMLLVR